MNDEHKAVLNDIQALLAARGISTVIYPADEKPFGGEHTEIKTEIGDDLTHYPAAVVIRSDDYDPGTYPAQWHVKALPYRAAEYIRQLETGTTAENCECHWKVHPEDEQVPDGMCRICQQHSAAMIHRDDHGMADAEHHAFAARRVRRDTPSFKCPLHTKEGLVLGFFEWMGLTVPDPQSNVLIKLTCKFCAAHEPLKVRSKFETFSESDAKTWEQVHNSAGHEVSEERVVQSAESSE